MRKQQKAYLDDPYATEQTSELIAKVADGIRVASCLFYPRGGGQPADTGTVDVNGRVFGVLDVRNESDGAVTLVLDNETDALSEGDIVHQRVDWERRYLHMRHHTLLHLLLATVGAPVTGGRIGADKGWLDFDLSGRDVPEKSRVTEQLNALIARDLPVSFQWVNASRLQDDPALVRTVSVAPPVGADGTVRLVCIGDPENPLDLQACGGTHVARLGEIGVAECTKSSSKGRANRRFEVVARSATP